MNFNKFQTELKEAVENELKDRGMEGISCELKRIDAPDGMVDRLVVSVEGSKLSMAFRLKSLYLGYEDGTSLEETADQVVNTIRENLDICKNNEKDVKEFLSDYSVVKKCVYLRLLPGNSPVLPKAPHKDIKDMAVVACVHLDDFDDDPDGKAVVTVTNELLDMYGISSEQLFEDAEKNSLKKEPIKLTSLGNMVASLLGGTPSDIDEAVEAYVVSNTSGFQGAAVIAYPDFFKRAVEAIGGSCFVLPSSVHEFILLKDDGQEVEALNAMVQNVNKNVLGPRDFLSDQCYHIDGQTLEFLSGEEFVNLSRGL